MSDAIPSAFFTSWQEAIHVYHVTLPLVPVPSRDPETSAGEKELFVLHAFNNIQDPTKRKECKMVVTHFFRTVAWLVEIQTGEEKDLEVLVTRHNHKKFICTYCHKEHTKGDAALHCIYEHLDYKPFSCGHNGKRCRQAKAQALLMGCGARFAALNRLNGHCR